MPEISDERLQRVLEICRLACAKPMPRKRKRRANRAQWIDANTYLCSACRSGIRHLQPVTRNLQVASRRSLSAIMRDLRAT